MILYANFVASTSTESKLRNPSFDIRQHQSSTPASSHPPPRNPSFGIQASIFGHINPPRRLRRIHLQEIQDSESKLRYLATSILHAGFVVSTSTESKLWNSIFDIRPHQSSTQAPTHPPLRNLRQIPSFGIQALIFGNIDPPRRLRCMILASISTESKLRYSECHISPPRRLHRIHLHGIQALQSKL